MKDRRIEHNQLSSLLPLLPPKQDTVSTILNRKSKTATVMLPSNAVDDQQVESTILDATSENDNQHLIVEKQAYEWNSEPHSPYNIIEEGYIENVGFRVRSLIVMIVSV